jgi:hypothetical protein
MKPTIHIRCSYAADPASYAVAKEVIHLFRDVLPGLAEGVRRTEAWTEEGRKSRWRMRRWMARVKELAKQTGEQGVIDAVDECIARLKGELPNLFSGGSIN